MVSVQGIKRLRTCSRPEQLRQSNPGRPFAALGFPSGNVHASVIFHPGPNPTKVALLLEELEMPFEVVAIDTFKGEQHKPEYLATNPNGKVPAIVDDGVAVSRS